MKINDIRKDNRPREKMIHNGVESLSNEELLAILIRNGNKKINAIDLATNIINSVSNISYLKDLTINDLYKIDGIKEAKATTILASFELSKRCFSYHLDQTEYSSCELIYQLMKPIMNLEKHEVFYTLFLDSKCHIIEKKLLGSGGINSIIVNSKEIIKRAIILGSVSIVLIHNHPSGNPKPSKEDISFTNNLYESLKLVGVLLLDHIIIGNDDYYSFSNNQVI